MGSNLHRLGRDDKAIAKILRQSNVTTTTSRYIKSAAADVLGGMEKLEHNIAEKLEGQNLRARERTPNLNSGRTPEPVN